MSKSTWNRMSPMEHTDMVHLLLRVSILLAPIIGASAIIHTYEVGGAGNLWLPNPYDPNFYSTWAASITFYPGDCLQFIFFVASYVYQLSQSDYQTCTVSSPLNMWYGDSAGAQIVSPFPSQSSYPKMFYFSAMLPEHCAEGMKFAANVSNPSSTPSPPGSTNSSSETPPSTPSGTSPSTPSGTSPTGTSPSTPSGTSPSTPSVTTPATNPGSTTPFGTLVASPPSSSPLSTKSIAGIVAGVVAALTAGGAGLTYKFHNRFACCVFNHNGAGNEGGNEGGNGAGNGAGNGVRKELTMGFEMPLATEQAMDSAMELVGAHGYDCTQKAHWITTRR